MGSSAVFGTTAKSFSPASKSQKSRRPDFAPTNFLPITLLILKYSPERSSPDRQLFYVQGGLLCSKKNRRGRLELRETLGGTACLAAVHDFRPALPWIIYRWTQAEVHRWFMYRLARAIEKDANKKALAEPASAT